jgi:hypothetical protein
MPTTRIIVTGLVIVLLSVLIVTLAVTGYAICLGVQARGAPEQARIDRFARTISAVLSPLLGIVLTYLGARHVRKKTFSAAPSAGLVLGIVVIVLSLLVDIAFGASLRPVDGLWYAMILSAGWLGGRPRRRTI